EIEECNRTEQFAVTTERQDCFRIEREVTRQDIRRHLDPRHQPMGHVRQRRQLCIPRGLDLGIPVCRQGIEIMSPYQRAPFLNEIAHLSSLLPLGGYLTEQGFQVCSNYCTGVLR